MAGTSQYLLLALLSPLALNGEHRFLTVHVFNAAKVPEAELKRAVTVTSKVFDAAGVQLEWRHHGESDFLLRDNSPLNAERIGKGVIVWLLPKDFSNHFSWNPTAGSTFEAEPGRERNAAALFYDRVVQAARLAQSTRYAILGYLMAHEIGHMLLGANAHEPVGLMRGTWEISEFRSAERGDLFFFDAQASKIRAEVARRMSDTSELNF
jgi:hypothetical protein